MSILSTGASKRILTFRELKPLKGWPYSRQHTHRLIRAGRFPAPRKIYEGGQLNIWDEDVIDTYLAAVVARRMTVRAALAAARKTERS
jgi:predicted DNA-binding transcriptional regulator AlpA